MRLNVITVHLRFENKINPPALPSGATNAGTRINLPHVTTRRYNWLSCHYSDQHLGSSLQFPLADGSATTVFLTSTNWLKATEFQEVLSYWHSDCISQKLSTLFAEMLSQKRSEPNKINAPQPPSIPISLSQENNVFPKSTKNREKNPCVVLIPLSFSLTRSHCLSPFYISLIQGDFHTSPGL